MFGLHEFVDWLAHSDPQSAKHETGDAPPFFTSPLLSWHKYLIVEIMKMRLNILKKCPGPIMTLKEELILWIWPAKKYDRWKQKMFFSKRKNVVSILWPSRMTKWPNTFPKRRECIYNTWSNWLLPLQLWWWQTFDNPLNINFLAICWTPVSFHRIFQRKLPHSFVSSCHSCSKWKSIEGEHKKQARTSSNISNWYWIYSNGILFTVWYWI